MRDFSKKNILKYIKDSPTPVTKREVARAFGIKGGENRVALKQILKQLKNEELIDKQPGGVYTAPQGLPAVLVLIVTEIGIDGEVLAKPLNDESTDIQRIEIMPDKRNFKNVREGSRALCRLSKTEDGIYEAHIIRLVDEGARYEGGTVLGMIRLQKRGAVLKPTHKKAKHDFDIAMGDLNGAKDGDLVVAEVMPSTTLRRKKVKVTEIIGRQGDPKTISLISLHEAGLNDSFPTDVVKETEKMTVPKLDKREDLRDIPLVTIDGEDARDFDDAVYARALDDGGYHLIVAIADVAHYVRANSALDTEAQKRGNSTYFPDRVVPMLPEALSNDLCSLRPNETRASLAVHLYIDKHGQLVKHKFVRALIKSHARLTYNQVQAAHDDGDKELEPFIEPLYAAYRILDKARQKRGALDLDLPEKQIIINDKGKMTGVVVRERFDAHKLIEEFMILANVAAAKALEKKRKEIPCVYRVHDRPSYDKLESAREFIESFGLSLPKGQNITPEQVNMLLRKASQQDYSHLISQMILRTQSQAVYQTDNIGHFGLALTHYAHFTSPIRRYADLLVHRALIRAYGLGEGALDDTEKSRIDEIAQHISGTERISMKAERSAVDRFTASYLSSRIGEKFTGVINGVTRFGLFVTLDENGADGLLPMKSLNDDFYTHDERQHALIGRRHGGIYRMGDPLKIIIKEADGITGSCIFDLAERKTHNASNKKKHKHSKNRTKRRRKA